jgi:hypothetical protein
MYDSGRGILKEFQFGILISPKPSLRSFMTFGGYSTKSFAKGYSLVSHPVSGSFHWAIHIVKFRVARSAGGGTDWVLSQASQALTDTGTTNLMLPKGKEEDL